MCSSRSGFGSVLQCHRFETLSGLRERIYLLSQQLDEKVANLHLPALGPTIVFPILEHTLHQCQDRCAGIDGRVCRSTKIIVEEFPEQGSHPFAHCDSNSFVFCSDLGVPDGFSKRSASTDKFLHSGWRYSRSFNFQERTLPTSRQLVTAFEIAVSDMDIFASSSYTLIINALDHMKKLDVNALVGNSVIARMCCSSSVQKYTTLLSGAS